MKFLYLFFTVLFSISLSCTKETTVPTTPTVKELLAGKPTITGINDATVTENAGIGFTINVPADTDIKILKVNIPIVAGATISPDPNQARDYTNSITYIITGSDGSKKTVVIKVVVAKSSAKQILTFAFMGLSPVVNGVIDQTTHKITATILASADIKKLSPTITFSAMASVAPASGVVTDFSKPVTYTVTAEDGSTERYEVNVSQMPAARCLLTRIENGKNKKEYISLSYDSFNRIVSIAKMGGDFKGGSISDDPYYTAANYTFEYNSNGDIIKFHAREGWQTSDYEFEYVSGKLVGNKFTFFDGLILYPASPGIWSVNEKNEVIQIPSQKFNFTNGNVTTIEYFRDGELWFKENISYDNKKHYFSGSYFKGIFAYIWDSIIMTSAGYLQSAPSLNNNPIKISDDRGFIDEFVYTYNSSGLPIQCQRFRGGYPSAPLLNFIYINCE